MQIYVQLELCVFFPFLSYPMPVSQCFELIVHEAVHVLSAIRLVSLSIFRSLMEGMTHKISALLGALRIQVTAQPA